MWTQSFVSIEPIRDIWCKRKRRRYVCTKLNTSSVDKEWCAFGSLSITVKEPCALSTISLIRYLKKCSTLPHVSITATRGSWRQPADTSNLLLQRVTFLSLTLTNGRPDLLQWDSLSNNGLYSLCVFLAHLFRTKSCAIVIGWCTRQRDFARFSNCMRSFAAVSGVPCDVKSRKLSSGVGWPHRLIFLFVILVWFMLWNNSCAKIYPVFLLIQNGHIGETSRTLVQDHEQETCSSAKLYPFRRNHRLCKIQLIP